MNPVVQPVRDVANAWVYPPGIGPDLFGPLSKLGMDAVEQDQVSLIVQLSQAWITHGSPNQPVRMGDDLSCALGDPTDTAAKARWLGLP